MLVRYFTENSPEIGRHGQITAIFEDRIELVELVSNGNGGWIERPASIALDDE